MFRTLPPPVQAEWRRIRPTDGRVDPRRASTVTSSNCPCRRYASVRRELTNSTAFSTRKGLLAAVTLGGGAPRGEFRPRYPGPHQCVIE